MRFILIREQVNFLHDNRYNISWLSSHCYIVKKFINSIKKNTSKMGEFHVYPDY